jgi:hypothetical protein
MESYKFKLVADGRGLSFRDYEENFGGIISTVADHSTGPLINDLVAVLRRHKEGTSRIIEVNIDIKN